MAASIIVGVQQPGFLGQYNPFAINKTIKSMVGTVKSVKRLRSGDILVILNSIMDAEFYTETILMGTPLPAINYLYPHPLTHRFWQDNDPKHRSIREKTISNYARQQN